MGKIKYILGYLLKLVLLTAMLPWTYRVEWVNAYPRNGVINGKSVEMNFFDASEQFFNILNNGIAWESIEMLSTNKITGKTKWARGIKW